MKIERKYLIAVVLFLLLMASMSLLTVLMEGLYGFDSIRLDIPTANARKLAGKLYVPSPMPDCKLPAILICSGANNEYNAMEVYAAQLASSGAAVLVFDPYNHGQSDIAESPSSGVSDALSFMLSLSFVDKDAIGAIAHTMGGYNLSIALEETGIDLDAVFNIDYIDIDSSLDRLEKHAAKLAFLLARYDEHQRTAFFDKALSMLSSRYSTMEEREDGSFCTRDGKVILAISDTASSLNFASSATMTAALSFFCDSFALTAPSAGGLNLIWQLRSVLGFALFFALAYSLVAAFSENGKALHAQQPLGKGLLLSVLPSVFVYALLIPLYMIGKKLLMPNVIFPQTDTNGLAIWAVFVGFVFIAFSISTRQSKGEGQLAKDIAKAAAAFALLYITVLALIWLSGSDLFILYSAFSPFTPRKALAALVYFPLFLVCFTGFSLFTAKHFSGRYSLLCRILFYCAGPVVITALYFIGFPISGQLLFYEQRFALISIIYLLPVTLLFALVDYRCRNAVFSSVLNAMLFTWYLSAANALYILL